MDDDQLKEAVKAYSLDPGWRFQLSIIPEWVWEDQECGIFAFQFRMRYATTPPISCDSMMTRDMVEDASDVCALVEQVAKELKEYCVVEIQNASEMMATVLYEAM